MTRTSRRLAVGAVAGLSLLALSGCGNSPVRSGAAAVIGPDRITTTELAGFVRRGLADPQAQQQLGADKEGFQRQTLARLINHDVLAVAAKEQGVTVTEGAVDARLADFERQAGGAQQLAQQAAQNGIAPQDLRRFVRDVVLNDAIGDALTKDVQVSQTDLAAAYAKTAAQNDQVHTAHILVAKQSLAATILANVRAHPDRFAALAAQFSTDTSNKNKGGDLGFAGRGQFVKPFETAVFAAKPGSYLLVQTQFGFHVVHVIERHGTTLAQAAPELRRTLLQRQREQLTAELLQKVAARLGVRVNPRFGRWDPSKGSVEPLAQDGRSVTSPAPADGGAGGVGAVPGQQPAQQQPAQQQPAPPPAQ